MVELNYPEIGKRIKEKRKLIHMTQFVLSEKLDVSPTYVSELENGRSIPSLATIVNIANILNASLEYLVLGITNFNSSNEISKVLDTVPAKNKELYIELCKKIAEPLK